VEVLGRSNGRNDTGHRPVARLGRYRAPDGSDGARLALDVSGPHAGLVVGKRGSGKSHTLGVLAEELASVEGIVPVVVDPMGAFGGLARGIAGGVVQSPTITAGALSPRGWCSVLGLDPEGAVGALVWRAASRAGSLPEMCSFVDDADATTATRRAARNHLDLAASWGVFDGGDAGRDGSGGDADLLDPTVTVLDLQGLDRAPANAVVRGVAASLYADRVECDTTGPLPWLLVDEADVFFGGVAGAALRRVLVRGRSPGVSLVAATQRPSALPAVAPAQADIVVAHRLTSRADSEALGDLHAAFDREHATDRRPSATGEALLADDTTGETHPVTIRERETPHGGESPRLGDGGEAGGWDVARSPKGSNTSPE